MPLTPPPDYTKAILAACIGLSLALLVGVYSRSTIPAVGDNLHSLPHGGTYLDGTKRIVYGAPNKLNSLEGQRTLSGQPWAIVIVLIAVIILLSRFNSTCAHCGRCH
ncbi:triple gene block protein 2 [Potato latent virus]|uniref:Movement protein TGB2 n=1 Tax=Potato latent virus TaxID=138982 RepID=B6RTB2_9VIRU|nr:triple gene block protein 2 [Potato latent virus]ACJ14320.1 triple gene block protein 2 [Potato latent virus]AXP79054.1 triple gene block protein 2 [Potato latent virus]QPD01719.1 TGB2 [Potato latent virus]WIW79789.1 triple gene block protein 2 [Potato latent virus]